MSQLPNCIWTPIDAAIMLISPAQGAVFAPLALQFVQSEPFICFSFLTRTPRRVPVQPINPNASTTRTSPPSGKKRNIAAIAGGIIGGAVAIFALIGISFFVQRRWGRRRARPRSILSFSTADSSSFEADPHVIVTPFDPNSYSSEEITQSSSRAEQRPLIAAEGPEGEMVALHRLSQTSIPPTVHARSRPMAPIPAGLSSKEVARLRAEVLAGGSPGQSHNGSSPNVSHSESMTSPENGVAESGEVTSPLDTRRLQSEVESLRQEMERLRAEGVIIEAPPSYTEGDR